MTFSKSIATFAVLTTLAVVPAPAAAQGRGHGRAVSRGAVRAGRPQTVTVAPYRPYYYRPYRLGIGLGFYGGYPFYGAYPYGYGAYPYYPYSVYSPYGYGPYGYPGYVAAVPVRPYGGIRINLPQKDAEVYVDGYFSGTVDDFDGVFQQLNLEPGPHHLEVRAPGFEPIAFDVNVEPGRTITYRAAMRPQQP
jgi:hypothetical protein